MLSIDESLLKAKVIYEAAAPVGDKASGDFDAPTFPHLYGGLNAEAVVAETPIERDCEGRYLGIKW